MPGLGTRRVSGEAGHKWALERPFVADLGGVTVEAGRKWALERPFVAGLVIGGPISRAPWQR